MSSPAEENNKTAGAAAGDGTPGVPGFRTWRGVYWFVFGCFIAVVIALTLFSRVHA